MAQVEIEINGRNYSIACDDGQEGHLSELGGLVNDKVSSLIASAGQIGDTRLLLMASLLLADDLADSLKKLTDTDAAAATQTAASEGNPATNPDKNLTGYDEQTMCLTLNNAAERMESIAEMLELS